MNRLLFATSLALVLPLCAQTQPSGQNTKTNQNQSTSGSAAQNSGKSTSTSGNSAATSQSSSTRQRPAVQSPRARRSYEVADLLNATEGARVAIEAQNKQDALFHINHALENADRIQPQNNGGMVVLYDELDQYSTLGPIMTQRSQAQNESESEGSPANGQPQVKSNRTHVVVQDVRGRFTAVGLDVQAAKDHLMAAKQAIDQNEWQQADAALSAVQNGLVVTTVKADLPLLRARENLVLARDSAENGHFGETHAALTAASRSLKEYANSQGSHAADARTLESQIDSYNQSVQQNHADAVAKTEGWWDQLADWTKPPHAQQQP